MLNTKPTLATLAFCTLACSSMAHDHVEQGRPDASRHIFIPNQGQWSGPFAYKAELGPLALFMEQRALTWSLLQADFAEVIHEASHDQVDAPLLSGHAWRVHFVDASDASMHPTGQAEHVNNYFLGNDAMRWRSNVPLHEEVRYESLWSGVDLRVYQHDRHFKYDLLLAPGTDPRTIQLRYEGVEGLRVDEQGRLMFRTSVGDVVEDRPVAWYGDAQGGPVTCSYVLRGDVLGFELKGADRSRPIVIDPTLIASTLSGSTTTNYGHCATYDSEGNIYTGAIAFGAGYPTNTGSFQQAWGGGGTDIAVSKLTPDGTDLIFATYLGGASGEYPHSLIVDDAFNLWVYGTTNSPDYPVTPGVVGPTIGGLVDIVVTKVGPTGGTLVGSTFIGGNANDGRNTLVGGGYEQYRGEIVVDADGNAYVASCTVSSDFPVSADAFQPALAAGQDGVVFSLDPTLTLLRFSTHLGGMQDDMAYGLKVRGDGVVVVSGGTGSSDFPVTSGVLQPTIAGGNDAFVTMLAPTGSSLVASTFWGTATGNVAYFIELDLDENVYIYGVAQGGVPIEPSGTYGVAGGGNFLAEFSSDLTSVVFTSCIGPGNVAPVAFLVDVCNNIYISGYQATSGMPTTTDALYTSGGFYIAVFQPHMTGLLYGTYYTGANHVDGGTSRFDKNGVIYQGVCTSGGLPLTPNAYGTTQASWDIGVFKIDMEQAGVQAGIQTASSYGCVPATLTFTATGSAPNHIWDPGDGSPTSTGPTLTHTYTVAGTYTVILVGWDSSACNSADTTLYNIVILDPAELEAIFTAEPLSSCDGYAIQLTSQSTQGATIIWDFGDGTGSSQVDPLHPYQAPGTYPITLTAINPLCSDTAVTTIPVVIPPATTTVELASPAVICDEGTIPLTAPAGFDSYLWNTGQNTATIVVDEPGNYWVTVTDGFCTALDTVVVVAAPLPSPMADVVTCPRKPVTLQPTFTAGSIEWNTGSEASAIEVDEAGSYWFVATDELGCLVRDTVDVFVLPETEVEGFVPNVFTPNGDGINDRFQVEGLGLENFRMEIYNRWGQVMFSTSNVQSGWNGGLDNTSSWVPDGTYYYIISYTDLCAAEPDTRKVGHVTLLR